MMASQQLGRLTGFSVIASSGTLLAAIGFGQAELTGGALFYLASATLAAGALFLVVELVERARQVEVDPPLADDADGDVLPFFVDPGEPPPGTNLDDDETVLIGRAIPSALAFLGLAFLLCGLVVAGLPPLSGFVGKVAMLSALLDARASPVPSPAAWTLFALLIASGLLATIALTRVGIRHFWAPQERAAPRLRIIECLPIGLLLIACMLLVVRGEAALRYMRATADALQRPALYIDAVLSARPVPGAGARP
jgi:multicomponent K+:H+ antiporter subunit D